MDSYQEFLNKLQKRGSKAHHIKHCLGARDAWKWVRKNKWKALHGEHCDPQLYGKIIKEVNQALVEKMMEGHVISFPYQMGKLYVASTPTKVFYKDGELKSNYRTDWKKTLEHWYEDEEARNSHKTIKRVQKKLYSIVYAKDAAYYNNRKFYKFRANRSLAKTLGIAVEKGKVNAEHLV